MKEKIKLSIRMAGEDDVPLILEFIRELADYEHMLDQVEATEERLKESIFERKKAEVLIAEVGGSPAGFALFFHNYSTFLGQPGIYLEDLFVRPQYRGYGVGGALLSRLASLALERRCGRLEWVCLDWNEPSIGFYLSLGAKSMGDWTTYRVTGETLRKLAEGAWKKSDD